MSNNRYHIHIVCADNDQLLFLNSVAIAFQARAFLTYDVSSKLPKASLYGRQCIDACDYALVLIGESYGTTQLSGVSQMHLSFLSAKAKMKPLLILIKAHDEGTTISRQLQEFTRTVENQAEHIHYYDSNTDIDQLLTLAHEDMIKRYEISEKWSKCDSQSNSFSKKETPTFSTSARSVKPVKAADSTLNIIPINESVIQPIDIAGTLNVSYSAQAYEGGNLTDVTRLTTLSWLEILNALITMPATFSSYSLQSCFNRIIAAKAESEIKKDMPNVHAVSRCQITQKDLDTLQRQLIAANWIELTTFGARATQELWKITFYAKSVFKEQLTKVRNTQS